MEREKRCWREKEVSKGNRKEFSAFVGNIPQNLNQFGLKGVFQKVGRVSDTYIPFRRNRGNKGRFSFVRFWRKEEAIRSIIRFDNSIIRGTIKVCWARYEKERFRDTGKGHPPREEWRRKQHQQENQVEAMFGRPSQEEDRNLKAMQGEVNQDLWIGWIGALWAQLMNQGTSKR